jgi:3-hydroxyacyl-[acyl-carrier-protein] dehydratase
MLLNDFFIPEHWQMEKTCARAVVRLDPAHRIFGGHFPGRPVVPGACLLQLVEELMARVTGKDGRLKKADHIKFVSMIDPHLNPMITMTITWQETGEGGLRVDAEASAGDPAAAPVDASAEASAGGAAAASPRGTICFKFKGIFQAAENYAG